MKYRILYWPITFLIAISFFTLNASAYDTDDFHVGVFGASLLTGMKQQGGIINNYNEIESIYDISFTFSIKGISDESIDYVFSYQIDELEPNQSLLFSDRFVNGFGPVIISLNASSSNAGTAEVSIRGIQLGSFTLAKPYALAWF